MGGLGQSILEEGKLEMILELIREGILTIKEGAKRPNMEEKGLTSILMRPLILPNHMSIIYLTL